MQFEQNKHWSQDARFISPCVDEAGGELTRNKLSARVRTSVHWDDLALYQGTVFSFFAPCAAWLKPRLIKSV